AAAQGRDWRAACGAETLTRFRLRSTRSASHRHPDRDAMAHYCPRGDTFPLCAQLAAESYFARLTMMTPRSAMTPPVMAKRLGTSPSQRKPSKVEIGGTL